MLVQYAENIHSFGFSFLLMTARASPSSFLWIADNLLQTESTRLQEGPRKTETFSCRLFYCTLFYDLKDSCGFFSECSRLCSSYVSSHGAFNKDIPGPSPVLENFQAEEGKHKCHQYLLTPTPEHKDQSVRSNCGHNNERGQRRNKEYGVKVP